MDNDSGNREDAYSAIQSGGAPPFSTRSENRSQIAQRNLSQSYELLVFING